VRAVANRPAPTRRHWRRLALVAVVLAAYPAFVLASVYAHWFAAGLPGGRNGPADAYRHALASATVAYTASPRCVDWATFVMERDGQGSASRAMDAHNNRIGARIGSTAPSWGAMQSAVMRAVREGAVDAVRADEITWLPRERWSNRAY
jgi:hypothetical protein